MAHDLCFHFFFFFILSLSRSIYYSCLFSVLLTVSLPLLLSPSLFLILSSFSPVSLFRSFFPFPSSLALPLYLLFCPNYLPLFQHSTTATTATATTTATANSTMRSSRRFPLKKEERPATATAITRSPSPPSAFEIPELVSYIFSFLDQNTLRTAAAPVCRVWFKVAQETLDYHLQLRNYKSKAWNSFKERLPSADSLIVGLQLGPWRQPISIGDTKLWNKQVMPLVCESLQAVKYNRRLIGNTTHKRTQRTRVLICFCGGPTESKPRFIVFICVVGLTGGPCPSGLRSVSLDMPLGATPVPLEKILTHCPELSSLSLSYLPDVPQVGPDPAMMHVRSARKKNFNCTAFPLTSLHLVGIRLYPQAFLSYVPFLQHLTDLSLMAIRDPWDPAAFIAAVNATPASLLAMAGDGTVPPGPDAEGGEIHRAIFWRTVGRHCPKLKRIRFSSHSDMTVTGCSVPLEFFPCVPAWGVNYKCIQASNPT